LEYSNTHIAETTSLREMLSSQNIIDS